MTDKIISGLRYTPEQQRERLRLFDLITAEKVEYLNRCEPHVRALAAIDARATPIVIIPSGLLCPSAQS